MVNLSHLTYEQRRTWEELDRTMHASHEGEAAAIAGIPAKCCPYEVEAGFDTLRRRWYEGYRHALELKRAWRTSNADYRRCRKELSYMPHTEATAFVWRLITRIYRSIARD
jgi:ribosome modulation factor